MFPGKSNISRRTKELELFSRDYVPYKCYRSSTGHNNIKFKYENDIRYVLFALFLLEKAITKPVEIAFMTDYAQVYLTTKRGARVSECEGNRLGYTNFWDGNFDVYFDGFGVITTFNIPIFGWASECLSTWWVSYFDLEEHKKFFIFNHPATKMT